MPKISKEKQQRAHTIYALVHDREVFVGRVQQGNHYQAYKDHINGLRAESREFCQRCEAAGELPKMYRLADMTGTARLVYRYRLAWYSFFAKYGFEVIAWPGTKDNMAELLDDTLTIYKIIEQLKPEDVLCEENLLVGNYRRAGEKKMKKESITVHMTPAEFDKIKKQAAAAGLSASMYCKNAALRGNIVKLDFTELLPIHEYFAELRGAKNILRMILAAYYQNGKYYPADLENIQKMVDNIVAEEKKLSENFIKLCKEIRRQLTK